MKKERPILFSTPMVQAILDGRKTQTRRVVKLSKDTYGGIEINDLSFTTFDANGNPLISTCPYGRVGDILWVRETFARIYPNRTEEPQTTTVGWMRQNPGKSPYIYLANENLESKKVYYYKPSIHMPKSAARIWLEITNIRIERLHDISEEDAITEGIEEIHPAPFVIRWKNYMIENSFWECPEGSFMSLWQTINGKESWESNPWVWVVEFKQIEKP